MGEWEQVPPEGSMLRQMAQLRTACAQLRHSVIQESWSLGIYLGLCWLAVAAIAAMWTLLI